MQGQADPREANGAPFSLELQRAAQARAWETLARAAAMIEPGMDDRDGKAIVDQVIHESGAQSMWHASQVRFGPNTQLPFGVVPETAHILNDNDIFFLDIGPCYDGHEGDVGKGFILGRAPEFQALIEDSHAIFNAVKDHWVTQGISGAELYDFAIHMAKSHGRTLALEGASGHRIGDFPHRIHHRGPLKAFHKTPSPNCWVLEIHVLDSALKAGAFFEDVL
jgi:Xaa-Pro aminopeptidase